MCIKKLHSNKWTIYSVCVQRLPILEELSNNNLNFNGKKLLSDNDNFCDLTLEFSYLKDIIPKNPKIFHKTIILMCVSMKILCMYV